jgi:hypothetical protein
MSTPKHLRKISDGRIFAYTEILAKRSDMVAVWEPGEEPDIELGTGGGLEVDPSDFDRKTKRLLEQKDKKLISTEKALNEVVMENQALLDEIEELKAKLEALGAPPEQTEQVEKKPAAKDLSPEDRMALLVTTVREMIDGEDALDFTGAGLPRIERLEATAGVADVTAEERNEAYHAAKAE